MASQEKSLKVIFIAFELNILLNLFCPRTICNNLEESPSLKFILILRHNEQINVFSVNQMNGTTAALSSITEQKLLLILLNICFYSFVHSFKRKKLIAMIPQWKIH